MRGEIKRSHLPLERPHAHGVGEDLPEASDTPEFRQQSDRPQFRGKCAAGGAPQRRLVPHQRGVATSRLEWREGVLQTMEIVRHIRDANRQLHRDARAPIKDVAPVAGDYESDSRIDQ
jgi:hypothetical protein